jgi:hypothetical protein
LFLIIYPVYEVGDWDGGTDGGAKLYLVGDSGKSCPSNAPVSFWITNILLAVARKILPIPARDSACSPHNAPPDQN